MKNNLLFSVMLFLLGLGSMNSQDLYRFVPIKFLDYTPKWFFYVEDSTAIGESAMYKNDYVNMFSHVKSIIRDNYLYSLYRTRLKCSIDGLYIEKRDINTGKKEWSYIHDLRDGGNNEIPDGMVFNKNGQLEIVGYRSLERTLWSNWPPKEKKLTIRILDPETGQLVDSSFADINDTLAVIINKSYQLFKSDSSSNLDSATYQYIMRNSRKYGYNKVKSYLLDSKGYRLEEKVTIFDSIYEYLEKEPFSLLEDNTFISTRHVFNNINKIDSNYQYRYFIDKYDRDLNILNSAEITDIFNAKNSYRITKEYVDNDLIIFKYINEPEFFKWKVYYYIFDHYGNLLDSINIYTKEAVDLTGTIQRISQNEFLIAGVNYHAVDKDFTLYFYKKKIGEPMRMVKKIKVGGLDIYYASNHYYPYIRKIKILENGDFLIIGRSGPKIDGNGSPIWPFVMYVPAKDLEGNVAIEETKSQSRKMKFEIYPNPSKQKINISFEDSFTGDVEIVDEMGRIVIGNNIIDKRKVQLDISNLSAGFYFIKAMSKNTIYKSAGFLVE